MSITPPDCTVALDTQTTAVAGEKGEAMRLRGRPLELLVSDFDRFYAIVHRYLLHRVFDVELAEDLTAETFYKAATRSRQFPNTPRHAQAWLLRTATNLVNTHHRRKRLSQFLRGRLAKARPAVHEPQANSHADQNESSVPVRAALMALRSKDQAVLILRYYTQLSIQEISEVLGCRQDAVRARLSRAMKNMRRELDIHRSNQDTSNT